MAITKLGTHVRLPDGRTGTVVYNSLIGGGIKSGRREVNADGRHEKID